MLLKVLRPFQTEIVSHVKPQCPTPPMDTIHQLIEFIISDIVPETTEIFDCVDAIDKNVRLGTFGFMGGSPASLEVFNVMQNITNTLWPLHLHSQK